MDDLEPFAEYEEGPPAPTHLTPPSLTNVPPELVLKLAMGMEEPVLVAKAHGLTEEQFAALTQWEPFQVQVASKRSELKQAGFTFRMHSAFVAEELLKEMYLRLKDPLATTPQVMEGVKIASKLGGLEPREAVAEGPRAQLPSITINLGPREIRRVIDIDPPQISPGGA